MAWVSLDREFHQAGARAKEALAVVKDSQILFGLGITSRLLSMHFESGGTRRGDPTDTPVPDCLRLSVPKLV